MIWILTPGMDQPWFLRSYFTILKRWLGIEVVIPFRSSCLTLLFGYQENISFSSPCLTSYSWYKIAGGWESPFLHSQKQRSKPKLSKWKSESTIQRPQYVEKARAREPLWTRKETLKQKPPRETKSAQRKLHGHWQIARVWLDNAKN